jgi:hypothetical protein
MAAQTTVVAGERCLLPEELVVELEFEAGAGVSVLFLFSSLGGRR